MSLRHHRYVWGPYNLERARRGMLGQVPWLLDVLPLYLHKADPATASLVIDWFNLSGSEDTERETISSLLEKYELTANGIMYRISRYLSRVCLVHGSSMSFVRHRCRERRWMNRQFVKLTRDALGEPLFWAHVEKYGLLERVIDVLDLVWDDAQGKYISMHDREAKVFRIMEGKMRQFWNAETIAAIKGRGQSDSGGGEGIIMEGIV